MKSSENNLALWNSVKSVPEKFTKKITGGRIGGMTDIKPQWRILKLTEHFGVCGVGWYYITVNREILEAPDGTKSAHVTIKLFIKDGEKWSAPIEGQGGSMLIAKEKNGLYHSDECYKMATTDALSVACKQLGIGSDVYMGFGVSKYENPIIVDDIDSVKERIKKGFQLCENKKYLFDKPLIEFLKGDLTELKNNLKIIQDKYKEIKG